MIEHKCHPVFQNCLNTNDQPSVPKAYWLSTDGHAQCYNCVTLGHKTRHGRKFVRVSVCLTYYSTKQSSLTVQNKFAFTWSTLLVLYQCAIQFLDMYSFYTDACVCVCVWWGQCKTDRNYPERKSACLSFGHHASFPVVWKFWKQKFYNRTLGFFLIFYYHIVLRLLKEREVALREECNWEIIQYWTGLHFVSSAVLGRIFWDAFII